MLQVLVCALSSFAQVPSLQGNWVFMDSGERMSAFVNSSGDGFMGTVTTKEGKVAFRIEGALKNGVMEGKVVMPPDALEHLPPKVVSQVLRMAGSSAPGWVEAPLKLAWDDAQKKWKGNRGSLSVTYDRNTHVVSRLVTVEGAGEMFEPVNVPDLSIESLTCETVTTDGSAAWQIVARIRNVGDADTPDRWKIELQTAMPKESRTSTHPLSRNGSESIRKLAKGERIDIVWNTAKPTDTANRPSLAHNIVKIRVNLDPEFSIDEVNERNNSRTLYGVSCKPQPLPADAAYADTVWVEEESLLYKAQRAQLETFIAKATTAESVLCYIKMEAKRRAAESFKSGNIQGSGFEVSLRHHFLKDYLANPTPATGTAAMESLGKVRGAPGISSLFGYYLYVPAGFRLKHRAMPEFLYPATHFAPGGDHAPLMRLIDGPFLVGDDNLKTGLDDDASGGGRNWSQPMHWATGVKYGNLSKDAMRELFIGYELWHLEGWSVFGEDAINDLIAEEQGRMLGARLALADITSAPDMMVKVNADFREARAWVGALFRLRSAELDRTVLQKDVPKGNHWWGHFKGNQGSSPNLNATDPTLYAPWNTRTIRQLIEDDGKKPSDVCMNSKLVESLIQIYQLIYECEEWEAVHGAMRLTQITIDVVNGVYDEQFKRAPKDWDATWEWTPR